MRARARSPACRSRSRAAPTPRRRRCAAAPASRRARYGAPPQDRRVSGCRTWRRGRKRSRRSWGAASYRRAQCAARDTHDTLDVGEMADDLLNAPFAALIAVQSVRFREAAQPRRGFLDLLRADHHRIQLRDALDAADVMRRDLVGLGAPDGALVHAFLPPSSVSDIAFT